MVPYGTEPLLFKCEYNMSPFHWMLYFIWLGIVSVLLRPKGERIIFVAGIAFLVWLLLKVLPWMCTN